MAPADREPEQRPRPEPRRFVDVRRSWADERRRREESTKRLEERLTGAGHRAGAAEAAASASAGAGSAAGEGSGAEGPGGSAAPWNTGPEPWVRDPLRFDVEPPRERPGPPPFVRLWLPVVLSFLVQVVPAVVAFDGGERGPDSLLGVVFAVVGPLALLGARRFPGPVVAIAAAASCADLLVTPGSGAPYLALAFAIVSAMVRGARHWAIASVAAGWAVALVGAILLGIDWHPFRIIFTSLGILLVLLVGEALRTRRERLALFRSAMRKRREDAAQAERERIARELHDVLARSLSLINVQAGRGLHLIDTDPDLAREALTTIRTTSTTALDEVRGVLGFLRSEDAQAGSPAADDAPTLFDYPSVTGGPHPPQPDRAAR